MVATALQFTYVIYSKDSSGSLYLGILSLIDLQIMWCSMYNVNITTADSPFSQSRDLRTHRTIVP